MAIFNCINWYWQLPGDILNVWSSARLMYVPVTDALYQSFLASGGYLIQISDMDSLNGIMAAQVVPVYLSTGLSVISASNSAINSTYALDSVTVTQIGTVAQDSACGFGLPLELATFTYPDINSVPQTFTVAEIQSLYVAMRDYIAAVYMAVAGLTHKVPGSALPTQPVNIA